MALTTQTPRILKAMDHPHFSMLVHPSGRLLEQREPYDVDMARIIHQASERGCYLELNAHSERLALLDSHCRIDRLRTVQSAVCRIGARAVVYSYGHHHGEEDVLRGWNGSGTIFFSGCNLRWEFCQNWDISQKRAGREVTAEELAVMMLDLQAQGCHNINFVSPSHVVAQILEATLIAAGHGLKLPLVYNSGGYDSPEALALLDGVIDIYMTDMKYGDSAIAHRYSHVRNYWEINQTAVREMHRQVDDLHLDKNGLAFRGLLVRRLVLPNGLTRQSS